MAGNQVTDYLGTLGFVRRNDGCPTVPPPSVNMTQEEFCSFSPGMRRELWRSDPEIKRMEHARDCENSIPVSDREKLIRRKTEVQISGRERL